MKEISYCLKQYINEEDYNKLEQLKNICIKDEELFLKIELDYKLNVIQLNREDSYMDVNEIFCYLGEDIIGYIGICNFSGIEAEITGMVHPLYRRKGIFTKLYNLAMEECKRRKFNSTLLVCDNKSASGLEFIKSTGAAYSFSEYEMELDNNYALEESKYITLRKASNNDAEEISTQNTIYFGGAYKLEVMPEDEEKKNKITYMIELNFKVIGKIKVDTDKEEGFISGFGILPEYRGKGYGRNALRSALHILSKNNIQSVALEVAAENKNALNLYKSCGFEEKSVTDYYKV